MDAPEKPHAAHLPQLALASALSFHESNSDTNRRSRMKRVVIAAMLGASALASAAHAQETIRVGWTIPAEEAKYWMMRRPEKFPNLGKGYKIEWSQFQGTSPMAQALVAGALDCATQGVLPLAQGMTSNTLSTYVVAQHVGENKDSFHLYWAVKEDSPIKKVEDLKGKTVGISIIGGGTHGPFALMLKKHGVDPEKDIKLVEVSFSLSEDALRAGRVEATNFVQPFAARAEGKGGIRKLFALADVLPNMVHIVEACRKDFVDKNPELVKHYVKDITAGLKLALANREETLKVVSEVMKAPIPVLDTYLLKQNDFAREPGAAPNFAAIQAMFDVYTDTKMIDKKLDANTLKHPSIVAPME
jgi:ABC-type nitrate/sulfonate/bicarbonate transport system substrate-binding protein